MSRNSLDDEFALIVFHELQTYLIRRITTRRERVFIDIFLS